MKVLKSILVSAGLALSSCALPREDRVAQSFVPERDLQVARLVNEGLSLFTRSRFEDAELRFRQALHLVPGTTNIQKSLAVALEAQGRDDEALDLVAPLLERAPDSVDYRLSAARLMLKEGGIRDAMTILEQGYDQAIEAGDGGTAARFARNLAVTAMRGGHYERALCASSNAVELVPTPLEVSRHARLLVGLSRYEAAERFILSKVASGVSRSDAIILQLAMAAYGKGDAPAVLSLLNETTDEGLGDPDLVFEARLLRRVVDRSDGSAREGGGSPPLSELLQDSRISGERSLYWPTSLLESLESATA